MAPGLACIRLDSELDDVYLRRRHCRSVFRAAYEEFREMAASRAAAPATDYERQILLGGDRTGAFPSSVVSASDWLIDFDKAGRFVLRESFTQHEIFVLHYLLGYAVEATMNRLGISGWRSWHEINKMVAEKVGGELLRRKLWPIHDRILRCGYLD